MIKETVSRDCTKLATDVNKDDGQCAIGLVDADDAPCNANISRIFENGSKGIMINEKNLKTKSRDTVPLIKEVFMKIGYTFMSSK